MLWSRLHCGRRCEQAANSVCLLTVKKKKVIFTFIKFGQILRSKQRNRLKATYGKKAAALEQKIEELKVRVDVKDTR